MALPTSLIRRHNHMNALSAIGMAPEKPVFPAVVTCPLCSQNDLYLYDDVVIDGIWAHCEKCRAHGDIITFAARIWNTSVADAMQRFVDLGAANDGDVDRFSGTYLRALKRFEAAESFWEQAAAQIWNHGDDVIACRVRELGLDQSFASHSGLIGAAHPDQVAELCGALGKATPPRMREDGPSLVFPYYDLPRRMSGLLVIQYNDEFMSRRVFLPISGFVKMRAEAGYFLLHTALLPPHPHLKNTFFVSDDLPWVLRAQATQLKAGLPLLPLAVSYSGPEAVSCGRHWPSISSTPRFFHSTAYTSDIVSQAANSKGYVCAVPNDKIQRPNTPIRTLQRLAQIRRRAETWQSALASAIRDINEISAQSFVSKMTVDLHRLQSFFHNHADTIPRDVGDRLLAHVEAAPSIHTKVQTRRTIIEKDGAWYTHTGLQVCNAQIRIDKAIHSDTGARLYSGRILLNNRELPFTERADRIESMGLLSYAAQHAAADGQLVMFDRAYNARSHLVAMQLREPEIIHVAGVPGWNTRSNEFCFYTYRLTNDGTILANEYPGINERVADFPEPTGIAPVTIRPLLAPTHENAFLWSVFGVVASNLLAPIMGKDSVLTACAANTFNAASEVAKALECREIRLNTARKDAASINLGKACETSSWPITVVNTTGDQNMSRVITRHNSGAAIVRLTDVACQVATGYGWQAIRGSTHESPPDLSALRYVLPSYIQHALERRLSFVRSGESLLAAVLADLAGWLKDIYGESFHAPCALNRLTTPDQAHEALMGVVDSAVVAGKLAVLPRPRRKDQPGNYVLRNKQHWWLNQKAIERYCVFAGATTPNWLGITELLERNGLLCGEDVIHNMPGLLVNKDWCDRFWSDYTTPDKQSLG